MHGFVYMKKSFRWIFMFQRRTLILADMLSASILTRQFSTSSSRLNSGLFHPKKLEAFNKRWSKQHKKIQFKKWEKPGAFPDAYVEKYGTKSTGIRHESFYEHVPEKVPELIVPDLDDCDLKPYVSYATEEIYQEELTSRDLFNVIYGKKIIEDFKSNKLDKDGYSLEPNELEKLSPETAEMLAKKTGSDIFLGGVPYSKTFALKIPIGKR